MIEREVDIFGGCSKISKFGGCGKMPTTLYEERERRERDVFLLMLIQVHDVITYLRVRHSAGVLLFTLYLPKTPLNIIMVLQI